MREITLNKHLNKELVNKASVKELMALDASGENIIHKAVKFGHYNTLSNVLKKGVNPNSSTYSGETPLHLAIIRRDKKSIKMLLKCKDIDINCYGPEEQTPLHYAIEYFLDIPLIDLLVNKGADINAPDEEGTTPLKTAVSHLHYEHIVYLLNKGAFNNKNIKSNKELLKDIKKTTNLQLKECFKNYLGDNNDN